ncbi:MAG: hypothetical protein LBU47_03640, partial [Christensenellaceae bacterium]|nr:hypothetical protein [Christensenellaceae bacterium]
RELWVSVYITPKTTAPGDHEESYATNDFGKIPGGSLGPTPTPTPNPGTATPTPTPDPGTATPTPTPDPGTPTPTPTPTPPPKKYDFLFVIDWSSSMNSSSMFSSTGSPAGLKPLDYAKNFVLDISPDILRDYPGSRIGVIGMNCDTTNSNTASRVNIVFDMAFTSNDAAIQSVLNASYSARSNDDNAQFLRAAIDKMKGLSTSFGGDGSVPVKALVPRDELSERIPVIIQMSDFQMIEEETNANTNSYWSSIMRGNASKFANDLPEGILLTVRFDSRTNTQIPTSGGTFNSQRFDDYMTQNVAPFNYASRNWGFHKVSFGTDYNTAEAAFRAFITSQVQP